MKDRARVIGGIETVRAAKRSLGPGWIKDPKSGLYVKKTRSKNMIVLAGLSFMAKSIQYGNADAGKTIRYIGVGAGRTLPAKDDVALVNELERHEIDSWDNTDIASDPVVMIATKLFNTTEANGNLMEAGLFRSSTGAPMFCRGLFGHGYITNATNADPVVIESEAHELAGGDLVYIEGVEGMTELNGNSYYVDVLTADTFALYSDSGLTTTIDGSGYGAYSDASPNTAIWTVIIPKTAAETLTINYSLTFPAE